MKNKISKILSLVVTISVLTSMLVVTGPVTPASAGTLSLSAEVGLPAEGTAPAVGQLLGGSDVTDMAVSGNTIYAISMAGNFTLKSTDGGTTWNRLTIVSPVTETPTAIAVAPGDANFILVATANTTPATNLFYSIDGGVSFSMLPAPTTPFTMINDVAISPALSGTRYLTAAGVAGGLSSVQFFPIGGTQLSTWNSVSAFNGGPLFGSVSALAIAFSPNFAGDRVLTIVTTNATGTIFEIANFNPSGRTLNAGNTAFIGYPVSITSTLAATGADISLAPTYIGSDETQRIAFVALAGASGPLVRINNTTVSLPLASDGYESVAYNGTNLVAGLATTNGVITSANPTASSVTVTSTAVAQRPGGANMVRVAWVGNNVVAGTSGASSCFAVSGDNGATFNDTALIDTKIVNMEDVAISADGATVFIVADNGAGQTSLWRKTTSWQRVLNPGSATTNLLRLSPQSANNTYLFNTATGDVLFSSDAGEKSWLSRSLGVPAVDLAVESAQVAYAVNSGGSVYKTTNGGFTWSDPVATGLGNAATITVVGTNQIIVGGQTGGLAWSTDGSASATTWVSKTGTSAPFTSGNIVATADNLTNGRIYAATSKANDGVMRWQVGTSTSWTDIIADNLTGSSTGITLASGALYVLVDEVSVTSNMSSISRTLIPTTATSTTTWSRLAAGSATSQVSLNDSPPNALKASTGPKLWAINTKTNNNLYSLTDTLVTGTAVVPAPTIPADNFNATINPQTGTTQIMTFSWPRLSTSATSATTGTSAYALEIALDSAFTQAKQVFNVVTSDDPVVAVVGPTGATYTYVFQPGSTYYWRVKATAPLESGYSTVRKFAFPTVQSVTTPFKLIEPEVGAVNVPIKPILSWTADPGNAQYPNGAIWYEVTMSEDPSFAIPEWSHNVNFIKGQSTIVYGVVDALKFNTTYYWRVRAVYQEPFVQGTAVITPAGGWQVGAFTTMAEPVTVTPPTTPGTTTPPAVTPPAPINVTVPPITVPPAQVTVTGGSAVPSWMLMTIIIIGAILIIALIVLIMRTRKSA